MSNLAILPALSLIAGALWGLLAATHRVEVVLERIADALEKPPAREGDDG